MLGKLNYIRSRRSVNAHLFIVALVTITALGFAVACSGSDQESLSFREELGEPGQSGAMAMKDEDAFASIPASTVLVSGEVMVEAETAIEAVEAESASVDSVTGSRYESSDGNQTELAFNQQQRIIIRDAEMHIEASNPVSTLERIGEVATRRSGWVVDSQSTEGWFSITVRIPAQQLDHAIDEVAQFATKVIRNSSTSRDFTEEFIDLSARVDTLNATREALQALLRDRELAGDLEDVLEVRREITDIETQLESIEGRLRFITQSAAFSKLVVIISPSPLEMVVNAGDEKRTALHVGSQFTARFFPPEGFDRFRIEWDFGDGTGIQVQERAIRTVDADGAYLTAPVVHAYADDRYSPYAVTVKVTAYSDTEVAQGEDQLWAHAAELPQLNIYAGDYIEAEPGEMISFRATFDDHVDVGDLNYKWTFGDGSAPVEGVVSDGVTIVSAEHSFERYQTRYYSVTFELWGDSVAGEIRETAYVQVQIIEPSSVDDSEFNPGSTATEGINTVISFASFAGNAAVWIGVTLPIWIALAALVYGIFRLIAWWRQRLLSDNPTDNNTRVSGQSLETDSDSTREPVA